MSNEIHSILLDTKDCLEWILRREEWMTLKEGSSADVLLEKINNILIKNTFTISNGSPEINKRNKTNVYDDKLFWETKNESK